ncbi:MAG: hypothetical protein IPM92_12960 [Saprospiraceae bacterium]|nr:hypothetical protein [Saprospiraceae bacterium]
MKIINLFVVLLIAFFVSCSSEKSDVVNINGAHIKTEDILNYIPKGLRENNNYVYFKNNAGEEKKLLIKYANNVVELVKDNEKYTTDQGIIKIYDETNNIAISEIIVLGSFNADGKIIKTLKITLMPLGALGSCFILIKFSNGEVDFTSPNGYSGSVTFNGNTFHNVFIGNSVHQSGFNEISYNKTEGIVSFKDQNSDYWVFDRFDNQ